MVGLHDLWLPVLLSAVFVFIVSSIIHMATPWHKNDYHKLPDEEKTLDTLRPFNIPPGDYMAPRASGPAEMNSPEFMEKMNKGPVVIMTVVPPGPPRMTANLVQWFLYSIVVSMFAGYVAGRALPAGAEYLSVFRFVGTTAFVGYSLALWQMSIWSKRSWATTIRATVDGFVYALITAGTFGWLWPAKMMEGM